jgi:beta propeller repeat protein
VKSILWFNILIVIGITVISSMPIFASCDFLISTAANSRGNPNISGKIVVWNDSRNGNDDIYGYNLETNQEFPVCILGGYLQQYCPAISGNIVVWIDGREGVKTIYGHNLTDPVGLDFQVCRAAGGDKFNPSIFGNTVVWQDPRNANNGKGWDIYGHNIVYPLGVDFPICNSVGDQTFPIISGDFIVWQDYRNGNWDIYGYNLTTQQEFPICTLASDQQLPKISGNIVVWQDRRNGDWDIYGRNITDPPGVDFPICVRWLQNQKNPAISGNFVVWEDDRNVNTDIYGYDLITLREFPICTNWTNQSRPAISDNVVVWEDARRNDGYTDIYGQYLIPIVDCSNSTIPTSNNCTGLCPNVVINTSPGVTITQSPAVDTPLLLGLNPVTVTVVDCSGNMAACSAMVTVIDQNAPVITCLNSVIIAGDKYVAPCPSIVTVSDNCDPNPVITQSPAVGDLIPLGENIITATAIDASGNQSSCTATVTVTLPSEIILPLLGWYNIAQPHHGDHNLADVMVKKTDTGESLPYCDAWMEGWVQSSLYYYDHDSGGYRTCGCDLWSDDNILRQGKGYWMCSDVDGLELIFP